MKGISRLIEDLSERYEVVRHDDFVHIFAVPPARTDTQRGHLFVPTAVHSRWPHAATVPVGDFGMMRGRHYHLGTEPCKVPEAFMLVWGAATFHWQQVSVEPDEAAQPRARLVGDGRRTEVLKPGYVVLVMPRVYHEVQSLRWGTLLAELMMTPDDINSPDVRHLPQEE